MPETPASTKSRPGASNEDAGFSAPQINLPKGGGAIRGIGEKFTANSATGTGSLSVPLALSSGRSGFGPRLSLAYDSGSGNGPFGIGWNVAFPTITRKTDKGLPRYRDHEESDVFLLSGQEDLVPFLVQTGPGEWVDDEFEREGYSVKRYRPRIEGLFSRIERWTRLKDGDAHWRSISTDNILTVYGRTPDSRIFDPSDPTHIFSWLICESYDDKGNAIVYEYAAENHDGVDQSAANEVNRTVTANRYLKRVRYGNRRPLLLDVTLPSFRTSHVAIPELASADWMFEAVLDYGESDYRQEGPDEDGWVWAHAAPAPQPDALWPVRKDPFSTYRSGFEVRAYRLCRRVLMFHHFAEELKAADCLVRSTDLEYIEKPTGSFITRVVQSGYTLQPDGRYLKKSLPPVDVDYTTSPLENPDYPGYHVQEADPENLPSGIEGSNYRWVDLFGEGISGVLMEQAGAWFYKSNAGRGRFRPLETISPRPSLAALNEGKQQLLDLDGDGSLDLVQLNSQTPGFYERTFDDNWGPFRSFRSLPVLDWENPNLRFVDVTGDGIADVLITDDDAFTWHPSLLDRGFGRAMRVPVPHDEREGPHEVFADGTQSIYLADMSGDGLSDIVRIRNGEVCYWPNLGYGKFGRKVTMDHSPWLEDTDLFDQKRIKLADTDGSGTTDILYLGSDGVRVYLNQAGNGWSGARVLRQFAAANDLTSISVVDLLGRGTACLVRSSALPADSSRPLQYLDLMDGQKPHLLIRLRNNLGAETRIEYASSTEFYLADKAAGTPWITRLPFPVQVVKKVETYDYISRNRFVRGYTYHHGYFDGVEREFRGFGRVDQMDTEELATLSQNSAFPVAENFKDESNVPPVLTKTWFHTGVYPHSGRISRHLEHEYFREPALSPDEQEALRLNDTSLPENLTPEEAREACRALKGSTLRQEIYGLDDTEESSRPYTVAETNFTIRLLQIRGKNRHAVFFTHARESITFNYERKLYQIDGRRRADPRVTHSFTLEADDFGNVLKSVSVGYGRRFADRSPLLKDADRATQQKILLTLTTNRYTNPVLEADAYRNPLLSGTSLYELIHVTPREREFGVTNLFRFEELAEAVARASDGLHDLPFEDVENKGAVTRSPYRRLLKRNRKLYRSDTLDRLLPPGVLQPLALAGENYRLSLTPGLLEKIYTRQEPGHPPENLLLDPAPVLRDEGGFVDLEGDGRWWAPSGRLFYAPEASDSAAAELDHAKRHFFLANRFLDPFRNFSTVRYDVHDLAPVESRDSLDNTVHSAIDYRILSPYRMTDANGNRTQVAFDTLGLVVGTAAMGKLGEHQGDNLDGFIADLPESVILDHLHDPFRDPWKILQGASTRLVYDQLAYARTQDDAQPQPAVVYTMARETHAADLQPGEKTRIQHGFSYSDGFNREIQHKLQAKPGPLPDGGPYADPRWIGSGWTIFNNKGKPVRQYEAFFSATQNFEFANIVGVSPVRFYDPVERVVATLHPDHTYEKVISDPWRQDTWDVNDTVLERNPANDPDVGPFFSRLPATDYLPAWYEQRENGALGPAEKAAAAKAAVHSRTPSASYFDSLGRSFLTIAYNRFLHDGEVVEERFSTRIEFDVQANQLSVTDALDRKIMSYDYDMTSTKIHQNSVDAGARWALTDARGNPIRKWDSRRHEFQYRYDALRRPTDLLLRTGHGPEKLVERAVYGEGQPDDIALNLRTRLYQQFDEAGLSTNQQFDFTGNLLSSSRRLLTHYHDPEVNWSGSPQLESKAYVTSSTYDALNRTVSSTTPDASVTRKQYNETNLLDRVDVNLRGAPTATPYVTQIDYNAKGQREFIAYGNGARTHYTYDPLTFRLSSLKTRRNTSPDTDDALLQELTYTYDPTGNITHLHDGAQEKIYFKNQVISPSNDYIYDAVYRLIEAQGREHIGQLSTPKTTDHDAPKMEQPLPGDGNAMRMYREHYQYDAVGNLTKIIHNAADGNWTRRYAYDDSNNRLTATEVGEVHEAYTYDRHGNTTRMPHLPGMEWDFKDQLYVTRRQVVKDGAGVRTYYVYNSAGKRIRKITERSDGRKADERIYLGGLEIYHEYSHDGEVKLERESLHVMDDQHRIALVETKTVDADSAEGATPSTLERYQFSNHLDSSTVELDESGAIISFEEYYPYGSTSYESVRKDVEVSPKRYRYTGMERDDETGFSYHGARYYAEWLGRWVSTDPTGLAAGQNLYAYVRGNPILNRDPTGTQDVCGVYDEDQMVCRQVSCDQVEDGSSSSTSSVSQAGGDSSGGRSFNVGGAGYGLSYAVPEGFTLLVPNSYRPEKMFEYREGVLNGEIGRNAGPGATTRARRESAVQRNARDEFEDMFPEPTDPAPGGRGWAKDHVRELQHDLTGTKGESWADYSWQDSALNSLEGTQSWQLQRNNPLGVPAGGVSRVNEAGRWYNTEGFRDVAGGVGDGLFILGAIQTTDHITSAIQADIDQGTGGAQTARATAEEVGGWTAAAYGGEAGAAAGLYCGEFAPICSPVLGLVGGGVGYAFGTSAVDHILDGPGNLLVNMYVEGGQRDYQHWQELNPDASPETYDELMKIDNSEILGDPIVFR